MAGEFKQGKSSLVNALLGVNVCPVDDDVATAVPTFIRYGEENAAALVHDGDPPRRDARPVRRHPQARRRGRVRRPRAGPGRDPRPPQDARRRPRHGRHPGVGGLGSAHAAAGLAAISAADAVLFVTDAAQELTRSELDFLEQARSLCSTVVCVLTKTDFYPAWRRIRDLDEGHLRLVGGIPIIPVSSPLRARAVRANDRALNVESGFPDLVTFVQERVGGGAADPAGRRGGRRDHRRLRPAQRHFRGGARHAGRPDRHRQRVIDELNLTKARVEAAASTAAARWNQTLNDGGTDLNADVDHDLRERIRRVILEADDAIDEIDPADMWPRWRSGYARGSRTSCSRNYTFLRRRATMLSEQVADHFREASGKAIEPARGLQPHAAGLRQAGRAQDRAGQDECRKQAMVALKSAYGGALMFTMLGALMGVASARSASASAS